MKRPLGVTLLELMIAIAIIGGALLALLGAVSFGLEASAHAARSGEALSYAREIVALMEERKLPESVTFADPPGARVNLEDPPFETDFPAGTGFTRNITATQLSTTASDYRSRLYELNVVVYWEEKGKERSVRLQGLHFAH